MKSRARIQPKTERTLAFLMAFGGTAVCDRERGPRSIPHGTGGLSLPIQLRAFRFPLGSAHLRNRRVCHQRGTVGGKQTTPTGGRRTQGNRSSRVHTKRRRSVGRYSLEWILSSTMKKITRRLASQDFDV